MNVEEFREFCLLKKGVTEHFPFDETTLVFKVKNKIFAILPLSKWEQGCAIINLKCNPEKAIELREEYEGITAGYHMNKKHWNTVKVNQDVPLNLVKELVNNSYNLVVEGLPKKLKNELNNLQ